MNKGIRIFEENGRRVVEGLGYYKSKQVSDLRELIRNSADMYGSAVGFKFKDNNGHIIYKTYIDFRDEIDYLGTALLSIGLKDKRIAVIGENRYEWAVAYYAVVNGTGVAVPLDKYLPQNETENLIVRSESSAIFYTGKFHDMMLEIAKTNEHIMYYICMDDSVALPAEDKRFMLMSGLLTNGGQRLSNGDRAFLDAAVDRDKMSVLLFTSGTTSTSKGVMLSHSNIAANVTSMTTIIYAGPGDVHLSLLPLHHTFENSVGMHYMILCGVCIAYCEGIRHIAQNMEEYGVTVLVAVPAIIEAMYKKLQEGIRKSNKKRLLDILGGVSEMLMLVGIDARRKIFKSVLKAFAPKLRLIASGAASLDPSVVTGFGRFGIEVLQGYGLTETSPLIAANNDFISIPETVGVPMQGIGVAIDAPDENGMGEIIARGPNVMLGYFGDPEATKQVIDAEGWFRTGDLGIIDKNGILKITGRLKSMIVFNNGKKAFPEEYELLLNNIPGVKESFVWGNRAADGDIQICAELVIDKDFYAKRGRDKLQMEGSTLASASASVSASDSALESVFGLASEFGAAIKDINSSLPQYKIIRYFVIASEEIIKTTTLKIKRNVEYEKIASILNLAGTDMRRASGKVLERLSEM